jgi:hypothetical protein
MLPGFRFLFTAIVLSMSILIFGLGAAALLRAAHEQFVSNPSWHAPPETMFAQQSEATPPVLAMLHVEPAAVEPEKPPDNVPAGLAPTEQATRVAPPPETATTVAAPEPEKAVALAPEQAAPAEVAKPEVPVTQGSASSEWTAAKADMPGSSDAPSPEAKIAATEQALPPPANETAPVASEAAPVEAAATPPDQAGAPAPTAVDDASTKIATLGGPPVAIEAQPLAKRAEAKSDSSKSDSSKPDRSAVSKRAQARRRKLAARARLARQAAQQPASPFAQQPLATTPARNP